MKTNRPRIPALKYAFIGLMVLCLILIVFSIYGAYYSNRLQRDSFLIVSSFVSFAANYHEAFLLCATIAALAGFICFFFSGYPFNFWITVGVIIFLLLAFFLVYPLANLFLTSFQGKEGGFSFENYKRFFEKSRYYKSFFNSIKVCVFTTVIALIIGLPMAYLVSRTNVWGKKIIRTLVTISLMSPPFIGAYSWIILMGNNGILRNFLESIFRFDFPSIYGFNGIVLVLTMKLYAYVFLYVTGALGSIDASLEEAAENLGVGKFKRMWTITLPLILPTIAAAALMVFMTSLADFGTPALIGAGYRVLPIMVYNEFMGEIGGNHSFASALSVIVILFAILMLMVQRFVVNRKSYNMSALRPPKIKELSAPARIFASLFCFAIVAISIIPQAVVIYTSFLKTNNTGAYFTGGFSLESYQRIWQKVPQSITNTFMYAIIAVAIMLVLGMLTSYLNVRRRSKITSLLDVFITIPYVVPGAVLGIMLLVAFNRYPLMLSGTAAIMIVAYVIRKLPYVVRSGSAILYTIDPSVEEASINLGVSPVKTFFKTTAILMIPGLLSGGTLSWITTINELSSSLMLSTTKTSTMSIAIYNSVLTNDYGAAAALSAILTAVTIVSLLLFNWLSKGKELSI